VIADLDSDPALPAGKRFTNEVCAQMYAHTKRPVRSPTRCAFASGKIQEGPDPHAMFVPDFAARPSDLMVKQTRDECPSRRVDVVHYMRGVSHAPNPAQIRAS